jgi:hypothetical protein
MAIGDPDPSDADRTAERAADLLPEEQAAGSDDPLAQAAAVLADSDERQRLGSQASDTPDGGGG